MVLNKKIEVFYILDCIFKLPLSVLQKLKTYQWKSTKV